MPVDFLSDEQARRYGHFTETPTPEQLARYFYLDDSDRELIAPRRKDYNQLGFAVQLGTVRFLGTFLSDLTEVPREVVRYAATQLSIGDPGTFAAYLQRDTTRREHALEIQRHYGYKSFTDHPGYFRLLRWLYSRAWLSAERPSVLFDLATARLVDQKILLPGASILARLVSRVRERAATRLYAVLAGLPSREQRQRLEALLEVPDGERLSRLEQLRRAPVRVSAPALVGALTRLREIRALGVSDLDASTVPPSRREALARLAATAWAQALVRMPEERRVATLLAFAQHMETVALDDALDVLDLLTGEILTRAEREGQKERLQRLRDFDRAALRLMAACEVLLDEAQVDADLRAAVFARVPRPELSEALATVGELARSPEDHYYEHLLSRWRTVRHFLPRLLDTIAFDGIETARPVLEAVAFLQGLEQASRRGPVVGDAPLAVMPPPWRHLALEPDGSVDRRFYTFCVLEQLQKALRRRDVFATPSRRWSDPRAKLLEGADWEAVRPQLCRSLGRAPDPEEELARLRIELDAAYARTAANLEENTAVEVERTGERDRLVLSPLDKLEEPESLPRLREAVDALMPRVDLPEVLLEVQAWTGFADAFTHASEGRSRAGDLATSVCAALVAEACNIGLRPLIQPGTPALTPMRLSWVLQNYLRAETLVEANARLVDYQATLPLAQAWGGGEVASADGLRFVVPVRTINAGPNPKYFGVGRGVTYYNFTSDQFTGFHAIVIPGTIRDSLYILSGLLEHQTSLEPVEVVADTAAYSDVVFGLFWLLGYQFSPRLADVGDARFWRIDPAADYGQLDGIARNRINVRLIEKSWDDLLRVAGSLKTGTVGAHEIMRLLTRGGGPSRSASTLARAVAEVGRVAKTLFLLAYLDDETYRRRVLLQLNRHEGRHRLARGIFHGGRGAVRKRYREGQEDQLGALGLVVNAVVLWNTRYLQAALNQLRTGGSEIKAEDVARLSPLGFEHINLLGRYHFGLTESVARGELRPLHQASEQDALVG